MQDRNLLLYRWLIFNTLMIVVTVALWWLDYLIPLFETDQSRLTFAIVALFGIGWSYCLRQVVDVSGELNEAKEYDSHKPATALEGEKAALKVEWLNDISEKLVGLGLLGTVIGFSIALSGIDHGSVADATGAQGAVAQLMQGMRVALNTTLLGAALAIWHEINMRMLRTAMGCLWYDKVRANNGEISARGQD